MSDDTRLTVNHNIREGEFDQITPKVRWNTDYDIAPTGEFKPAAWLPIVWTDAVSQDAYVISAGKAVAFDRENRLVPAGLRIKLLTQNLVYTSVDVKHGVHDLTTGKKLTGPASYTPAEVAQALVERGLVLESEISGVSAAQVIPAFISQPVGCAAYNFFVWAGEGPGDYHFHNYSRQHLIQFLRQTQLILPHISAGAESADTFDTTDPGGTDGITPTTYAPGTFIGAGELWEIADIRQLPRYSYLKSTASVVALGLDNAPVARNTDRTPFGCDVDGVLLRERTSPSLIKREGDWCLDASVGVLFLHADTWDGLVAGTDTDVTFSYHYYTSGVAASNEKFAHIDGVVKPGDLVTVDQDSNYVVIEPSTVAELLSVVGRVHSVIKTPRGMLDRVKTAWGFSGAPKEFQMPGSATKGYEDSITLTDQPVADELVTVFIDAK